MNNPVRVPHPCGFCKGGDFLDVLELALNGVWPLESLQGPIYPLENKECAETAFHALTPGRQRGYLLYFSAAKQSKTRVSRIEKWMRQILKGKGLNDQ